MNNKENESTLTRLTLLIALVVILLVTCTACSTVVPVSAKFPNAPDQLLEACPPLKTLGEKTTLSEMTETVNQNYSTYYSCSAKHDGFIEWYQKQKAIFDNAGK